MELRPRIRHAVLTASLGALIVPATAGAAVKQPIITKVTPKVARVGDTLTVYGKNFRTGRGKNSVLFKRDGGKAIFVKTSLSTKKMFTIVIPATLQKYMAVKAGIPQPARFRLRVLTTRLGKRFTALADSPVIGPYIPPANTSTGGGSGSGSGSGSGNISQLAPTGDCDGDGLTNAFESDTLHTDPCKADTDGDGISDGFEYRSAVDLNNDEYRAPTASLPYPGKRPYPNPLDGTDASTDYDGDGLPLYAEYRLWRYTVTQEGADPSLEHLTYSDGLKYSIYAYDGYGHRVGALAAAGYNRTQDFVNWLNSSGYINVSYPDEPGVVYNIFDVNRNHVVDSGPRAGYVHAEDSYLDTHGSTSDAPDGLLSDDERDEDADGLSNIVELRGESTPDWWKGVYSRETPFNITYAGTQFDDVDSDGDGVRDGADDQDHDDYDNLYELSRNMITGRTPLSIADASKITPTDAFSNGWAAQAGGRVNPFNPCLPNVHSRTCPFALNLGEAAWAPFDGYPYVALTDATDPNYLVMN